MSSREVQDLFFFVADFHVLGGHLEFLIASTGFVLSFVVLADVSQKVTTSGVLDLVGVNTVDNKPWNVVVVWSLKSDFVLESVTGFA